MIKTFKQYPNLEFIDLPQGSPEWYKERLGSVGSSEVKAAFAGGQGKTRTALMERKVRERHTGQPEPTVSTFDMRWGIETEPEARRYFERVTGRAVVQSGMVRNRIYPGFHTSTDGLIFAPDGLYYLEIKCPKFSTHLKYLDLIVNRTGWTHPVEYKTQFNAHCIIPECKGGFFVSYFPKKKALEILGEDAKWSQIVTFVPPPDKATVADFKAKMATWNMDYAKLSDSAELLVERHRAEQIKKKNNQVAMIAAAKRKTELFLEKIR